MSALRPEVSCKLRVKMGAVIRVDAAKPVFRGVRDLLFSAAYYLLPPRGKYTLLDASSSPRGRRSRRARQSVAFSAARVRFSTPTSRRRNCHKINNNIAAVAKSEEIRKSASSQLGKR
jgi:hypothetical protein